MRDHRRDVIVHLLERLNELVDPVRAGNGDGQTGLLLMPATYTPSVRELERLLVVMRLDRSESLLLLGNGRKASVRACWWHLNERYLRATTRTCWRCPKCSTESHVERHTHRDRRGKLCAYPGKRVLVNVYDPGVDEKLVDAGVGWLAEHWALAVEPMLPRELMVA